MTILLPKTSYPQSFRLPTQDLIDVTGALRIGPGRLLLCAEHRNDFLRSNDPLGFYVFGEMTKDCGEVKGPWGYAWSCQKRLGETEKAWIGSKKLWTTIPHVPSSTEGPYCWGDDDFDYESSIPEATLSPGLYHQLLVRLNSHRMAVIGSLPIAGGNEDAVYAGRSWEKAIRSNSRPYNYYYTPGEHHEESVTLRRVWNTRWNNLRWLWVKGAISIERAINLPIENWRECDSFQIIQDPFDPSK